MNLLDILSFTLAMFLLAIIPGAGVFAVISTALISNMKNTFYIIAGIVLGDIIFLLLAIFSLGLIQSILGELFIFIKYLGGLYLLYIAYKIFTSNTNINIDSISNTSKQKNFFAGFIITLSNPKVILFYISFLPTFISLDNLILSDILIILGLVIIVLSCVMSLYAFSATKAKQSLKSQNNIKIQNYSAASAMSLAGFYLLFSK